MVRGRGPEGCQWGGGGRMAEGRGGEDRGETVGKGKKGKEMA